jgi:hypothetical protein
METPGQGELPARITARCFHADGTEEGELIGTYRLRTASMLPPPATMVDAMTGRSTLLPPPWTADVWGTLRGGDDDDDDEHDGESDGDEDASARPGEGRVHLGLQFWDPAVPDEVPPPLPLRRIRVTVLSASHLPRMDLFRDNDPYVVVDVAGVLHRTRTVEGGGAGPVWGDGMGQSFDFFLIDCPASVRLSVMAEERSLHPDATVGSADELIGACELELEPSREHAVWERDEFVRLRNAQLPPSVQRDDDDAGKLRVKLRWDPDPSVEPEVPQPGRRLVVVVRRASGLAQASRDVDENDP